jgi:hypothetical protein
MSSVSTEPGTQKIHEKWGNWFSGMPRSWTLGPGSFESPYKTLQIHPVLFFVNSTSRLGSGLLKSAPEAHFSLKTTKNH